MSNAESSRPFTLILLLLGLVFFISAVMFVNRFTGDTTDRHRIYVQPAPLLEDLLPVAQAGRRFERILRRANPEMVLVERVATVSRNLADWLAETPPEGPVPGQLDSLALVLRSLEYTWGFEYVPLWEWRVDVVRARRQYFRNRGYAVADSMRLQTYLLVHQIVAQSLQRQAPLDPLFGWAREDVRPLAVVEAECFSALFDSTLGRGSFAAQNTDAVERIREVVTMNEDLKRFLLLYDATQVFRLVEDLAAGGSIEVTLLPPEMEQ